MVPPQLQGVGITERLNEKIPLDLEFTDQNGKTVKLGDYFHKDKPVILTPIFYECPMLFFAVQLLARSEKSSEMMHAADGIDDGVRRPVCPPKLWPMPIRRAPCVARAR